MRFRTRDLARFFALMLTALLTLPSLYDFNRTTVKAYAQGQSKADVPIKPRVKKPGTPGTVQGGGPANDNCANAVNIASCPFTDTRSTVGASDEAGEPASLCTDQANSVWYTFTNTSANRQSVSVQTCGSDFDTALQIYQVNGAACAFANFVVVDCNDDSDCGNGLQSQASFLAEPGQTYKIQAGGFDGDTGSLSIVVDCEELLCDDIVVNGQLGLGSPDHPSTSGQQTPARLFRDGIASTCDAPKTCPGPFGSGSFTFDAYTFTNESSEDQCVTVLYNPNVDTKGNCNVNAHAIAYLNSFSPTNLCLNYLADVGSSDELPFSFTVPAGANFVVVIAANNPGGVANGCEYQFTVRGNICEQFDFCVQDDLNPGRFIKVNSTTGAYEFHDCGKGVVLTGTGAVVQSFPPNPCKIELFDFGPNPKRPDRSVSVLINPCTFRGDASVSGPGFLGTVNIGDSNVFNNTCECPVATPR
jgi:hypothetical protein